MFAALALLGCDKEHTPIAPIEPGVIGFGNVTTRAVDSADDINEFPVWACMADPSADYYAPILTNERVYKGDNGQWKYDNTRLWIANSHFFFLSVFSDADTCPLFTENKVDIAGNGSQHMVYTMDVTTPNTADMDILTAFNYTNTSGVYSQTVSMQFSHLLTKVNLKIRQDFDKDPDFDYFVTKVTITGIKNSGRFGVVPYASASPYYFSGWTFAENATTLTVEKTFDTPQILRAYDEPDPKNKVIDTWGNDGILLIPQEIVDNTVKVRIDYLYDETPGDNDPGTIAHYVEGFLPTNIINEEPKEILWQSGKSINYTIKVAEQNDISFAQPTIDPWGSPQTGGTIIIK